MAVFKCTINAKYNRYKTAKRVCQGCVCVCRG